MKKHNDKFAIPGKPRVSLEADEADRKHKAELKKKAAEPIPPGRLAALVQHLGTKEGKEGRR